MTQFLLRLDKKLHAELYVTESGAKDSIYGKYTVTRVRDAATRFGSMTEAQLALAEHDLGDFEPEPVQ